MKKINKKILCILGISIFLICIMGYIFTQRNENTGSNLQDSSSNLENKNTTEDSLDTNQLEWDYIEEPNEEMKEELEKSGTGEETTQNSSSTIIKSSESTKKTKQSTSVKEKISENTTTDSEETESATSKNTKLINQNKQTKTTEETVTVEKSQNTQQKVKIEQEQNSFSNTEEKTTMYELPMDVFD